MHFRLQASLFIAASSAALLMASSAYAQGSAANAGAQVSVEPASSLETVVVTARRRAENEQSVPVAVTAFSSADLEAHSFQRPQDLTSAVPSIYVFGQNRDDAEITMRGQSQGTINPGQRTVSGVQTYFDDVPTLISGPGVFFDLQSVQILKGPQGTLFGRNTTGGAVLYQSALPVDHYAASLKVSAGNYGLQEYEGMANLPILGDKLMLRVAGDLMRRDGFTTSVITGQDQDNVHYNAFRISLLWQPTSRFSNLLVVSGRDTHNNGTSAILRQINPDAVLLSNVLPGISVYAGGARPDAHCGIGTPSAACLAAYSLPNPPGYFGNLLAAASAVGGFALLPDPAMQDALAQQQAIGIRHDMIPFITSYSEYARGIVNTTTYEVTNQISLKNIFGYNEVAGNLTNDFSGTAISFVNEIGARSSTQQITDEFQVRGTMDSTFNWILGTYFEQAQPAREEILPYSSFGTSSLRHAGFQDHSYAAFAHFEKDASQWVPGLTLSGGMRYTKDVRSARNETTGLLGASPLTVERGHYSALTWDATADYHWNDRVMTYIAARRGYKTGGFNLPSPSPDLDTFGPEHVTDVEAGLKADWNLGGVPLRTNVAGFHDWYDNAQVEVPAAVGGGLQTLTESTGKATIYGGEFEGTIVPVDDLTLSAFASIDHARYSDECTPALNATLTACGRFPFVPEVKFGFSGQWKLPFPAEIGDVTLNADYSWVDTVYTQDKAEPLNSYPSFSLVNLRVDWKMFDWGVTASAFVTNLTDEDYIQGGYPLASQIGFESVIYGPPRMFGFSLAYKFDQQ